jgi:hypothetical protein
MKGLIAFVATVVLAMAPAAAQKPVASAPLPIPNPDVTVDADFLIGMWSDQADCSGGIIDIRRDGTFVNLDRSHGTWRLSGDMMTLTGTRALTVRIVPRNNLEMTVVNADGTQGYSRRCIGPNRPLAQ